jgi:hypothetical protein
MNEILSAIKISNSPSLEKIAYMISKGKAEDKSHTDINLSKVMHYGNNSSTTVTKPKLQSFELYFKKLISSSTI